MKNNLALMGINPAPTLKKRSLECRGGVYPRPLELSR